MTALPDLHALRAFFASGATRPAAFRLARLADLAEALRRHEDRLFEALSSDLGKPRAEAALSEIGYVRQDLAYTRRRLRRWMRPAQPGTPLLLQPGHSEIRAEPKGCVLILSPWNYPLQLALSPLVAALAAGNTAVLKPSELAPRTAEALADLVADCLPPDYCAVCPGDADAASRLLDEPFDHIFFTGGAAVGREVMRKAALHLTPVTLELGGKSPALVFADADLPSAARRLVWGKFLNAGQTCTAPDHVLVDRRIYGPLLAALAEAIGAFYGPDPGGSPDYGRIVNTRHFDRLVAGMAGARISCGGGHDRGRLFLAPTVLTDVPPGSPLLRDEIFGPLLPVAPFDSLGPVLADLKSKPRPLALYVFTRSRAIQETVLAAVPSGGACINDTLAHMLSPRLPFGGTGASGMGAYHGKAGFDTFSHFRSVLRRGTWPDPRFRYPPYRLPVRLLMRLLRFLLA